MFWNRKYIVTDVQKQITITTDNKHLILKSNTVNIVVNITTPQKIIENKSKYLEYGQMYEIFLIVTWLKIKYKNNQLVYWWFYTGQSSDCSCFLEI